MCTCFRTSLVATPRSDLPELQKCDLVECVMTLEVIPAKAEQALQIGIFEQFTVLLMTLLFPSDCLAILFRGLVHSSISGGVSICLPCHSTVPKQGASCALLQRIGGFPTSMACGPLLTWRGVLFDAIAELE